MNKYSNELNVIQLIALMKEHGIKKVVASPGTTNISFVGSLMNDSFFQVYSCVDERSAAYIACGMAEETGEPVALSCTGATAARNYPSGLTEAFYRKLPILAITSTQHLGRVGQLMPQITDRSIQFKDIVNLSVYISCPYTDEDKWANNVKINNALLQLRRAGGGPVHINLQTNYSRVFNIEKLPEERVIRRYLITDQLPTIKASSICIIVGAHKKFSKELESVIDEFCSKYNSVVLCDQTSNYKGNYRVLAGLVTGQREYYSKCQQCDLVIHIGEISGTCYDTKDTDVWRVNPDGEVRDTFRMLKAVFEMDEMDFFKHYNSICNMPLKNSYLEEWNNELVRLDRMIEELPLSNVWMCKQTSYRLPENSVLYLGILNSLRSWSLYDIPKTVYSYSTVGGFGIDGTLSSCVGASIVHPDRLYFCVLGDLSFFYDINVLGNRNIGNNLRILLSNNGTGFEMHCANSNGLSFDKTERDMFFCAGGHNGKQSRTLVKHFAEDLGFEYISAETKQEYLEKVVHFIDPEQMDKPIVFEVFVDVNDDDVAYNATKITMTSASSAAKRIVKELLGEEGYTGLKKIIKK